MADNRDVTLKCADNGGYIVCFYEVVKGNGTYGCSDHKRKEEVFTEDQGIEALDRVRALSGHKAVKKAA